MDTESVDSGMTASHSPIKGREYADAARSRQSAYVWKTLGLYGMSDSGTDATQPSALAVGWRAGGGSAAGADMSRSQLSISGRAKASSATECDSAPRELTTGSVSNAHSRHAPHTLRLVQGEPSTIRCAEWEGQPGYAQGRVHEHRETSTKGAVSADGHSKAAGLASKSGGVSAGEGGSLMSDVDCGEQGVGDGIVGREAAVSTGCAASYARSYGL